MSKRQRRRTSRRTILKALESARAAPGSERWNHELTDQLIALAAAAEEGAYTDISSLTDEEYLARLRRL